jgi:hypothetical protein
MSVHHFWQAQTTKKDFVFFLKNKKANTIIFQNDVVLILKNDLKLVEIYV